MAVFNNFYKWKKNVKSSNIGVAKGPSAPPRRIMTVVTSYDQGQVPVDGSGEVSS